jgi:hypothetical protein
LRDGPRRFRLAFTCRVLLRSRIVDVRLLHTGLSPAMARLSRTVLLGYKSSKHRSYNPERTSPFGLGSQYFIMLQPVLHIIRALLLLFLVSANLKFLQGSSAHSTQLVFPVDSNHIPYEETNSFIPSAKVRTLIGHHYFNNLHLLTLVAAISKITPDHFQHSPEMSYPKSQPFYQRYRSILPTSLTHIILINQRLITLET